MTQKAIVWWYIRQTEYNMFGASNEKFDRLAPGYLALCLYYHSLHNFRHNSRHLKRR